MSEYEIFRLCFPEYEIAEGIFNSFALDGGTVFHCDGGFAVVRNDRAELLCVAPAYREQGRGAVLLKQCEEHIIKSGYRAVSIGGGLICGAEENSVPFFEKQGYTIGGCPFNEMELDLSRFTLSETKLSDEITFGFYEGDIGSLHRAVFDVDEEWVQYFTDEQLFFCGYVSGELASFCIVGTDEHCLLSDGKIKVGSVGCVGTIPKFRGQGIGMRMVALASEYLKKQNCDKVFIHYTHIDKWYRKLGARVFQRFRTAEKKL